jgi:hypothetical protein
MELSCTVGGNVTGPITMEINKYVPQIMKINLSYDPTIPLLCIYSKECESICKRDT